MLPFLLTLFGPIIADIFKKWFEKLISKTVAALPADATAEDVLREAFRVTKPREVGKRMLLSRMLTTVHMNPEITKLSKSEVNEFTTLTTGIVKAGI